MRSRKMILVADTGVLFSAVLHDGLERKVLKSKAFKFVATNGIVRELQKVLESKMAMGSEQASANIGDMKLAVVEDSLFSEKLRRADMLIGKRDESDVPTVALALAVENDGVWSSDKDFEPLCGVVRVWSSRELLAFAAKRRRPKV